MALTTIYLNGIYTFAKKSEMFSNIFEPFK